MDWDKIRIFHAAAEAGSFTHAGEQLDMSQSAVSRQVGALERDLSVTLFHRHARGLVLTEQGEMLHRTAHDVFHKLKSAETRLADSKTKPQGDLRVTTPVGLGASWLTPRIHSFLDLYPDINLELLLHDHELDLSMREADIAIWLHQPTQSDLIQRKLFTVHFHVYASVGYVRRNGSPKSIADLEGHPILTFGGTTVDAVRNLNWLETAGLNGQDNRTPLLRINSLYALKQIVRRGLGIAVLPDYMAKDDPDLVLALTDADLPEMDTYFVYPEELRNSKRVNVFRDFLITKAREWSF